jgi:hypothetical protein
MQHCEALESELFAATFSIQDIKALKSKLLQLVTLLSKEKELKKIEEERVGRLRKKIVILTEHVEKLMKVLRVESISKIKALEAHRVERFETKKSMREIKRREKIGNANLM